MPGRKLAAEDIPTPGPWVVRGKAGPGASPAQVMLGVEPATEEQPGGWRYLIRRDHPVETGGCPLHIATGIQRLANAKLMAAAPDLAGTLLRLLIASALGATTSTPARARPWTRAGGCLCGSPRMWRLDDEAGQVGRTPLDQAGPSGVRPSPACARPAAAPAVERRRRAQPAGSRPEPTAPAPSPPGS